MASPELGVAPRATRLELSLVLTDVGGRTNCNEVTNDTNGTSRLHPRTARTAHGILLSLHDCPTVPGNSNLRRRYVPVWSMWDESGDGNRRRGATRD